MRRLEEALEGRPRLTAVAEVTREMVHEWRADRVTGLAAEVAFFGLLSLFPTLLATTAALGSLQAVLGRGVARRAEDAMIDFLNRVLTDEAAGIVDAVRDLFAGANTGLLTLGLVLALWAASRGFAAIINALDVAYDIDESRPWVRIRARGLGLALGSIVVGSLLLAMVVLGPLLGTGREVADAVGLGAVFATFWDWARLPTAIVVLVAWAATVFHIAPNHRTPWRWDVPGALLSAFLWAALSLGFRAYLSFAAEGNQILGTLGGTLIVVLWLYLMSVGLILGGELNAILARRAGVVQQPDDGDTSRAVALWRAARHRLASKGSAGD